MSQAEGPCGKAAGRRHRWYEITYPAQPRAWWCTHCGKRTERNPR